MKSGPFILIAVFGSYHDKGHLVCLSSEYANHSPVMEMRKYAQAYLVGACMCLAFGKDRSAFTVAISQISFFPPHYLLFAMLTISPNYAPFSAKKSKLCFFFFPNWQQGMHNTAHAVYNVMYMYESQIGAVRVVIHDSIRDPRECI